MRQVLLTGALGVLGQGLREVLESLGYQVLLFDVKPNQISVIRSGQEQMKCSPTRAPAQSASLDIRKKQVIAEAMLGCCGVIHFGAVSRVAWAQREPEVCWQTNVEGTRNVIQAAMEQRVRPWLLFASSREVYGQPRKLPVVETSPIEPVNLYGQSKAAAEELMWEAREAGLQVGVLRFTNVYGATNDYADRVIPSLMRRAINGEPLLITGGHRTFDFLHINDLLAGVLEAIQCLEAGECELPPLHLLSGEPITLRQLAQSINRLAGERSSIFEVEQQHYDVTHFFGDSARAQHYLGWYPHIPIEQGLQTFYDQLSEQLLLQKEPV